MYLNPAFAGTNSCPRLSTNHRAQWTGLPNIFNTTSVSYDQNFDKIHGGLGIIIINVLLCVGSLNLNDIVLAQKNLWYVVPLFPMVSVFFISAIAETNRPPFDVPEAEAELVAGCQKEY